MNAYTMPARPVPYMPARPLAYRSPAIPQVAPPPMSRFQATSPMARTHSANAAQRHRRPMYTRPAIQHATAMPRTWQSRQPIPTVPTPIQMPATAPMEAKKRGWFREDGKLYSVLIFFMFWMLFSCTFVGYYVARSL